MMRSLLVVLAGLFLISCGKENLDGKWLQTKEQAKDGKEVAVEMNDSSVLKIQDNKISLLTVLGLREGTMKLEAKDKRKAAAAKTEEKKEEKAVEAPKAPTTVDTDDDSLKPAPKAPKTVDTDDDSLPVPAPVVTPAEAPAPVAAPAPAPAPVTPDTVRGERVDPIIGLTKKEVDACVLNREFTREDNKLIIAKTDKCEAMELEILENEENTLRLKYQDGTILSFDRLSDEKAKEITKK